MAQCHNFSDELIWIINWRLAEWLEEHVVRSISNLIWSRDMHMHIETLTVQNFWKKCCHKTVINFNRELDQGSIRSSPSYGLSTPYRLTFRNSARLFHHVLFNMGDLHLVLPALNAAILIRMQQVRLMMFSLNMVDYSMSFLSLSTWDFVCWTSRGDHSEPFWGGVG